MSRFLTMGLYSALSGGRAAELGVVNQITLRERMGHLHNMYVNTSARSYWRSDTSRGGQTPVLAARGGQTAVLAADASAGS